MSMTGMEGTRGNYKVQGEEDRTEKKELWWK